MKANKTMILKVTKNRFNGRTDQWIMDIDYSKMRFEDHVGINGSTFDSGEHKEKSEKFAKSEIQRIHDEVKSEMKSSVDDILTSLGI